MENIAIKTLNLTKKFGGNIAVNKVSLEVKRGELFGLVGPDGAGKTTMMRLLTSIMEPDEGEAWVSGLSILKDDEALKEKIGYMSQRFGLYEDLTVMENIDFYADLYAVPLNERPPRIKKLLEFSNLSPFKSRLAGALSGGMKQKLGLACALIHTPEVLFLDEPTNGVDPVSRRDFWKILYGLLKEGISIFISTSYLDEAERCSRVALIDKGRLLVVDEPSRIRQSINKPMMEIWVNSPLSVAEIIGKTQGIIRISAYGDRFHVIAERREVFERIISDLKSKNINVEGQREIIPSLEDVFISMVS